MTNLLIYLKPFAMLVLAVVTFVYTIYLIRKDKLLDHQLTENEKFKIKTKKKIVELSKDHLNLEKVVENSLKDPVSSYAHIEQLAEQILEKTEKNWTENFLQLRDEIDKLLMNQAEQVNKCIHNFEQRQLKLEQLMATFSNSNNIDNAG